MSERLEEKSAVERAMEASASLRSDVAASVESSKNTLADATSTAKDSTQTAAVGAKNFLERNPLGLAIGAVAVGFLIGLVVPMGELEREKVGPFGETLTRQARGAASDLVTQGKTVVLAAVTTALKNPKSS